MISFPAPRLRELSLENFNFWARCIWPNAYFTQGKAAKQYKNMLNRVRLEKVRQHGRIETRRYTLISARAFIWTHGDTMYLDTLYVDKKQRKQGLGSLVLHAAESKGLVLNCTRCITDTLGFQAQPFYEKLGYQVIAEVPDYIQGHARIYLEKSLR